MSARSRAPRQRNRTPVQRRPPWLLLGGILGALVVAGVITVGLMGGHGVTEIGPAQLQSELTHKDFTLLNVKTPYIGEIEGTDLWIPYDQLAARTSELPSDKSAKIVVYCRTGNESAIAVQTLTSLGYTNLEELSGGMTAWTAAGGALVSVAR